MNNTTDLSKSFSKLKNNIFRNYNGVLIELNKDGCKAMGQQFYTKEELDKEIKKRGELLSNSISK